MKNQKSNRTVDLGINSTNFQTYICKFSLICAVLVDLYEANFQLPFTDNRQSLKESQYQKYLDLGGAFVNERVQTNDLKGQRREIFLILSETKSWNSR